MHRQGFDLQLTQYDDRGWPATFYTTGIAHSPPTRPTLSDAALGDATLTAGFGLRRRLPAVPTLKHPEQEEAEGGVPGTVLEDAPLDFRARACNKRLGVRSWRRSGVHRAYGGAYGSHVGGYEQYAYDGEDQSDAEEPHLLASRQSDPATQRR